MKKFIKITKHWYIDPDEIQAIKLDEGLDGGLEIVMKSYFIKIEKEDKEQVLKILIDTVN